MARNSRTSYGFGAGGALPDLHPMPIIARRSPLTSDFDFELGSVWINTVSNQAWHLTSVTANSANWALTSPGASDVDTLTGDAGGGISPVGGNITLAGGTNLATAGAGATITFNLDAAITLATSVTSPLYTSGAGVDTSITAPAGQEIVLQLGDAAGATTLDIEDSASATVASIDSNGTATFVGMDGILGAVTPAAATVTTLGANTSVTSPLFTAAAADALVQAGGANDVVLRLGDAAGATLLRVQSSTPADVFTIDSTGALSAIAGATITGAFAQTGGTFDVGQDNAANAISIGGGNVARAIGLGNSAAAHTITIGDATAGAITVDTAAGISLDSATASNFTVTGAADLTLSSSAGGVDLTSGEATATAISMDATDGAGGITMAAGTGGILIGNQADCTTLDLGDFAPTATRTITIGGGTVVTAAVTDTVDIGPDGATTNANSIKTVNVNTGGVTTGQVLTNIASGTVTSGTHTTSIASGNRAAGTMALNLITGTGTKTLNVGNADALTTANILGTVTINNNVNANFAACDGTSTGTITLGGAAAGAVTVDTAAGISLDSATASNFTVTGAADLTLASTAGSIPMSAGVDVLIDAVGVLEINSSAGVIGIGNDAVAQNINVGTGAAARTITMGNVSGASSVVVDVGTGAASFGASATAHTTTIGSTTGASSTVIQSGTGEITVTGTVKDMTAEFVSRSGDNIPSISQSPILQSSLTTGAAPTGATGDVNLMMLQEGVLMEQFIMGAGQTIIAPRMDANGLLVSLDLTATEGAEYNFGAARTNSRHAFTIGTSAAFFIEVGLYINDMDGADPYVIGFRRVSANNGTMSAYSDYAAIGMNATSSITNVVTMTELNSGGQTVTDTTDAWGGDGSTNTLRVLVDGAGAVTYTINGAAPSASAAFTFDNGDVVAPYLHFLHSANPTQVNITSLKVGFQA